MAADEDVAPVHERGAAGAGVQDVDLADMVGAVERESRTVGSEIVRRDRAGILDDRAAAGQCDRAAGDIAHQGERGAGPQGNVAGPAIQDADRADRIAEAIQRDARAAAGVQAGRGDRAGLGDRAIVGEQVERPDGAAGKGDAAEIMDPDVLAAAIDELRAAVGAVEIIRALERDVAMGAGDGQAVACHDLRGRILQHRAVVRRQVHIGARDHARRLAEVPAVRRQADDASGGVGRDIAVDGEGVAGEADVGSAPAHGSSRHGWCRWTSGSRRWRSRSASWP